MLEGIAVLVVSKLIERLWNSKKARKVLAALILAMALSVREPIA
ncbi:hypothetical protein [Shouchella shacheensis]|nr:hypothetical protein [Shouchella shacheensis]